MSAYPLEPTQNVTLNLLKALNSVLTARNSLISDLGLVRDRPDEPLSRL